jgi:antitoxin component of RelBE/YafQ-DinJ toxin-antitoxin module
VRIRQAYEAGYRAALEKLALDPPTQVDSFVANVESGKDMPFDPSMQVPENAPGIEGENPEAPILPQDEAMALGQPTGAL